MCLLLISPLLLMNSSSSGRVEKDLSNIFQIRDVSLESNCFRYVKLLVTSGTASPILGTMLQKHLRNKPCSKNLKKVVLSFQDWWVIFTVSNGYHLYVDNFTRERLFKHLAENGTIACGIAMGNCMKASSSLKAELFQKGEYTFQQDGNMLMVQYNDKKEIYFLSVMH